MPSDLTKHCIPGTLLLALAGMISNGNAGDYFPPIRVGAVSDARITELSGMVPMTHLAEHYWIHNDSGDAPRIFALRLDGAVPAEVTITGATATDWEDIATGPGPVAGESYLYIADTGNNDKSRSDLAIFRVLEPRLMSVLPGQLLASEGASKLAFRYPDGNFDAEGLVVHPSDGNIYLFTKAATSAAVYRLPSLEPGAGVQTLVRVGTVAYGDLITGADLTADGQTLLVRTYSQILELTLPPGAPFERIFFQAYEAHPGVAAETKSESICFDHRDLDIITTNESIPAPIHRFHARVPQPMCLATLTGSSPRHFVRGDVLVEDAAFMGDVDAADAAAIVEVVAGLTSPPCHDAADANDDGALSLDDATTLLTSLVSARPLASPFPATGLDFSSDTLSCREQPAQRYLDENAVWHYWHEPTPPQVDWRELDADVSTWQQGPGGIGFGSSAPSTVPTGAASRALALRARCEFGVASAEDLSSIDALILEIDYNDGLVAYLNGVEVARRGLGDGGFEVPGDQVAKFHLGGVKEDIHVCVELLRPGRNVLAVELRNRTRFDRTLFFRAGLRGSAVLESTTSPSPGPASGGKLRFHLDRELRPGEPGVISVLADSSEPLRGASFSLQYDPALLAVMEVAAPADSRDRVLEAAVVDPGARRLHYAQAVRPEALEDEAFAAGQAIEIARISCRVLARGTTHLAFVERAEKPRVESMLVLPGPRVGEPELENFEAEITSNAGPLIQDVIDNSGGPGTLFFVTGSGFEAADLQVKVCGLPAIAELLGDGKTLRVKAPNCGHLDFAPLEICAASGCDRLEEGFFYSSTGPLWIRGDANADGTVDISDAVAILADLFLGVTVRPACTTALDANADGRADLSDAVFILGFLFQGGTDIAAPFPAPAPCAS